MNKGKEERKEEGQEGRMRGGKRGRREVGLFPSGERREWQMCTE